MKAIPYSEIGPLEKGKPVRLDTQAIKRFERTLRDYACGACLSCLTYRIVLIDGKSHGILRCAANETHHSIRRNPPPNRPLRYGELKQRGMIKGGPNDD